MSEVLEKAIARILYNKLIEHFDDIELLTQIQRSQDFALVCDLEKMLTSKRKKQNIDYNLVVDNWSKFHKEVKELNKENKELISHILDEFKVATQDDFLISGTLYNHKKLFIETLSEPWSDVYRNYLLGLDGIICKFRTQLLQYEIASAQDEFFDSSSIIREEDIKFQKSNFKNKSIYLDTNAVQALASNHKIKKIINESDYYFVYSSFLIEDACNSNPMFLKSFCSDLSSITDGEMVGYMDKGLCYVKEKIEDTIARVSKYSKLTKIYERQIMINFIQHYHAYPELRKGRELSTNISSDVISFFKRENKIDVTGFKYVISEFSNTSIREFVHSGNISVIEDNREVVRELSNLFDFVNFETEKIKFSNLSKIASSYRDRQHLEHAYICDYFVTDDIRLKNRAQVIYEILGIKTKVISVNDLKSKFKSQNLLPV